MAMKEYYILPKSPELEPCIRCNLVLYIGYPLFGSEGVSYPCRGQSQRILSPTNRKDCEIEKLFILLITGNFILFFFFVMAHVSQFNIISERIDFDSMLVTVHLGRISLSQSKNSNISS